MYTYSKVVDWLCDGADDLTTVSSLINNSFDTTNVRSKLLHLGLSTVADNFPPYSISQLSLLINKNFPHVHKIPTIYPYNMDHIYNIYPFLQSSDQFADDIFQTIFPARTELDLQLRNIRASELLSFIKLTNNQTNVIALVSSFSGLWDYISVYNLILFHCLYNFITLPFWLSISAFKQGTWYFAAIAKYTSDTIKTVNVSDDNIHLYYENDTLTGYRNPPTPNFDVSKDIAELVGSKDHSHSFFEPFSSAVARHLTSNRFNDNPYMSLYDWIKKGSWATPGSSSVGKITIRIDGEPPKTIKAKKNTVLDVLDVDFLYNLALNAGPQYSKIFIKAELGKIRLAVSSDLANYLIFSWIIYLSGNCYLNWSGVTLEETQNEKIIRIHSMRNALSRGVVVPFDFKGFDRQPTLSEIWDIVSVLIKASSTIVPVADLPLFLSIVAQQHGSFMHPVLSGEIPVFSQDGTKNAHQDLEMQEMALPIVIVPRWASVLLSEVYSMESGLSSGINGTSIIGNGYNKTVTSMVIDILVCLGMDRATLLYYVQGDDTILFFITKRWALLAIYVYKKFGISFSTGKFSIRIAQGEYLRIWYKRDRSFGYVTRTLPNLVQRKPWSNMPWTPDSTITGIWSKIGIIARRANSPNVLILWNILLEKWCSLHNINIIFTSIPRHFGGLGVGFWDGKYRLTPKLIPIFDLPPIVAPTTNYRTNKLFSSAIIAGLPISIFDANILATEDMLKTMSADNVPLVAKELRAKFSDYFTSTKFMLHPLVPILYVTPSITFLPIINTPELFFQFKSSLRKASPFFGMFARQISSLGNIKRFIRFSHPKTTLSEWLKSNMPEVSDAIRMFSSGATKSHMSEVLDYLAGIMPLPTLTINPDILDVFVLYVLSLCPMSFRNGNVLRWFSFYQKPLEASFNDIDIVNYSYSRV